MRIFDPKDQLGNSLLSQADTQKSSVKLEKQMAVGGAITLTSTDISDIENWELSNARVKVDGQMISFLPDTSRDEYGNITIVFGERFEDVILVLKRVDFGGVITIEIKIQQLMAKTLATAGKIGYNANANITAWQELGVEAKKTGEEKYKYADVVSWTGDEEVGPIVTEQFLSLRNVPKCAFSEMGIIEWSSDLPCLQYGNSAFSDGPIEVFEGNMPNLVDGSYMFANTASSPSLVSFKSEMSSLVNGERMFDNCIRLTECTVALPNSLQNASFMFCGTKLTEWTVALPNSITTAEGMFMGCSGLTRFASDMPTGLTTNALYMFKGCKLDIESVERISSTIANCTATDEWHKTIHLGVLQACHDDTNFQNYIDAMEQKNWVVVVEIH